MNIAVQPVCKEELYCTVLFSERLRLGFYAAKNILRLTRAFAATRGVIADLREFFTAPLPAPGSFAHLFPSPLQVPTYTDSMPSLTLTQALTIGRDCRVGGG